MIPVLDMEQLRYFFNINSQQLVAEIFFRLSMPPLGSYLHRSLSANDLKWAIFAVSYKLGYRFPPRRREESPDSKEQCTGEEPGIQGQPWITDSATENNRSLVCDTQTRQ